MAQIQVKYMNTLRALGIIAVVLGHCAPNANIVYSYHMALFFFASGYFYNKKYLENPRIYIIRKIKSLYIPFVVYSMIFLTLRNYFINIKVYDSTIVASINTLRDYVNNIINIVTFNYSGDLLIGSFWFLKIMFYVNILYFILNIVFNKLKFNEFTISCIITSIYIASFYLLNRGISIESRLNPNNIKIISVFTGFFDFRVLIMLLIYHVGFVYRNIETKIEMNLLLVIVSIMTIFYFKNESIDVSTYVFKDPIYFIIISIVGIYINIYVAKLIAKKNMKILEFIGENSFIIMTFHILAFKLIDYIQIVYYKYPIEYLYAYPSLSNKKYCIIYLIVGVSIPLIFKYLYDLMYKFISELMRKIIKS